MSTTFLSSAYRDDERRFWPRCMICGADKTSAHACGGPTSMAGQPTGLDSRTSESGVEAEAKAIITPPQIKARISVGVAALEANPPRPRPPPGSAA